MTHLPTLMALLLQGTPSGEDPGEPLHPMGQQVSGEGWGRLIAWPELRSLDHPDALPMLSPIVLGRRTISQGMEKVPGVGGWVVEQRTQHLPSWTGEENK